MVKSCCKVTVGYSHTQHSHKIRIDRWIEPVFGAVISIYFTVVDSQPLAVLSTFNLTSIFSVMSIKFLKGLKNQSHPDMPGGSSGQKQKGISGKMLLIDASSIICTEFSLGYCPSKCILTCFLKRLNMGSPLIFQRMQFGFCLLVIPPCLCCWK